ncbi:MAG: hypothetical protein R3249_06600 [Nitriliruptorales bacterium]|nr:hypothetical protein [Nitriliruptorales bacterium]
MARHLVVGNQTLLSRELRAVLEERAQAEEAECHIHVVVPDTPMDHYRSPVKGPRYSFAPAEDDGPTMAEHRLEVALDEFSSLDAIVTGVVGDEKPLAAIHHALAIDDYDEIIVSTFPAGLSRWLRTNIIDRLAEEVDLPVTHVVGTLDPAVEDRRRHEELVRSLQDGDD